MIARKGGGTTGEGEVESQAAMENAPLHRSLATV